MNKNDVLELLCYLQSTKVGFYLKPEKSWSSWLRKLDKYSYNEAMSAVEYLEDNTAPEKHSVIFGNPDAIKSQCERSRARQERNVRDIEGEQQLKRAGLSFKNVPGKTRSEQVVYVCAERSAYHWRNGETDNEYFNTQLGNARNLGFLFDGVDYSKIKQTESKGLAFTEMIGSL